MDVVDYKHTVSKETSKQSPRRDLLRSFGTAIITTGERTYKIIEEQNGTIGWLARKLAFIVFPILWWIRFQWLSQLSFIDKQIQTVEWITCMIFPQSEWIFSKIDNLARFADSVPDKLDNVINAIGDFVGKLPGFSAFDWAKEVTEEIFKNMVSFIPDFGSSYADKSVNDDISLAYEMDENLRTTRDEIREGIKNAEMSFKEGVECLERMKTVESDRIKDDGFVSQEKSDWSTLKGDKEGMEKDVLEMFDAASHQKKIE